MTSPYSQSICYQNANATRPHFGISASSSSPKPTRPSLQGIGFMNNDWVNPNIKIDEAPAPFPCSIFYQNQNQAGQMDVECWQCIRGQILETINKNKDKNSTSCIDNGCANLTIYSDTTIPSPKDLCEFLTCVKQNRSRCTDELFYTVFGNDANAQSFSESRCNT